MPTKRRKPLSQSSKLELDEREQLKWFLDKVLAVNTPRQQGMDAENRDAKTPGLDDIPTDAESLPDFMEDLMRHRTKVLQSSEDKVKLMVHVLVAAKEISQENLNNLFEKASELLSAQANRILLDTISKRHASDRAKVACSNTEDESSKSMEALLLCLSGERKKDYKHLTRDLWFNFLNPLDLPSKTALLKQLLEVSSSKMRTQEVDPFIFKALAKGVEAALSVSNMHDATAQLLRDEVEESHENPACFLQTTPLAKFLSYRDILLCDGEDPTRQEDNFIRLKQWINVDRQDDEQVEASKKLQEALRSVLKHLLKSDDETRREAVLSWIAAVINKNMACPGSLRSGQDSSYTRCGDVYMLSFCSLVLDLFNSLKSSLPRIVDYIYYSSSKCRVHLNCEVSLAGSRIEKQAGNVDRERIKPKEQISTECYHLCQRAFSVGILKTVQTAVLALEAAQKDEEGHLTEKQSIYSLVMKELSPQVTEFYLTQCNQLSRLLNVNDESHSADGKDETLPTIPQFCVEDLTNWIIGRGRLLSKTTSQMLDPILQLCLRLLTRADSNLTAILRFQMVQCIAECVKNEFQSKAMNSFPSDLAESFPALLRLYVDVSALEGLEVFYGTFSTSSARHVIAKILLKFWRRDELQVALRKHNCRDLLTCFLSAVLETVVLLTKAAVDKVEEGPVTQERHQQTGRGADCSTVKNDPLLKNFQLLQVFALNLENAAMYFTQVPLARQADVSFSWLRGLGGDPEVDAALKTEVGIANFSQEIGKLKDFISIPDLKRGEVVGQNSETVANFDCGVTSKSDQTQSDSSSVSADAMVNTCDNWRTDLAYDADEVVLMKDYEAALGDARVSTANLVQSHSFRAVLEKVNPSSKKMEVLKEELEYLQKHLPVLPDKAIFVVRDNERDDVLRCVVSGPVGTPYSGGLFVFDVYCPDGYPSVPPLVRFLTTGYGTADFHACLHSNGEVFLNLLGTGFADDGSEAWNPETSSISQVLESIQSVVLQKNPLHSYRGASLAEESEDSKLETQRHNSLIRALTQRYAMLELVRNPPVGLKEVICKYFCVLTKCHQQAV